jgi:hypothetical protein
MLGPVRWGSYPGEYLELAMAVLLAQDHPETLRRTPASGDGGIDLMVPDGEGYEVRQTPASVMGALRGRGAAEAGGLVFSHVEDRQRRGGKSR